MQGSEWEKERLKKLKVDGEMEAVGEEWKERKSC